MSVGIGMVGAEIVMQLGGAQLQGVISKSITRNNTRLDTTDDNSSGFAEALATSGVKSTELSFSGLLKNLELVKAYAGNSQLYATTITYPDGSTEVGDFFLDSISNSGESNDLVTFDASCSSSGEIVFTAGV